MAERFELILCRNRWSPASHLLRFHTWSRWSHSAILDTATSTVYDSTFKGRGCKETPFAEWATRYTTMERRPIPVPVEREAEALGWLLDQWGTPYDWTAIAGFLFRRNWQKDDAWFCSEHTETFYSLFAHQRIRSDVSRVTPGIQEMLV